jgi:hypothetical protein
MDVGQVFGAVIGILTGHAAIYIALRILVGALADSANKGNRPDAWRPSREERPADVIGAAAPALLSSRDDLLVVFPDWLDAARALMRATVHPDRDALGLKVRQCSCLSRELGPRRLRREGA